MFRCATMEDSREKERLFNQVNNDSINKTHNFEEEVGAAPKVGFRHLQVFLYFLICFLGFGFRAILSVAIVAMTDPAVNKHPGIPTYPEWTDKNVVLSAFFWGYVITQTLAGWVAGRYGAKWFLIGTFGVNSIIGFFIPQIAALLGSKGVMLGRAIQGLCQGFIFPSLTHLLSQWVPSEERSRLGTITYAAGPCGTVLAMLLAGRIADSAYGWPMTFYLYGVFGIIWCILMIFFGYDSPAQHPSISQAEKLYIEKSLGHTDEKAKYRTPWKEILTSGPVWALFITQIGNNFCFWTLLTQIPSYLNYIMNVSLKNNGILSALPYLTVWILSFLVGIASDLLVNKGILTRTISRKVFNSLGLFLPSVALILLGYTNSSQPTQGVILLILAVGTNAFHFSGFSLNHMDLSPNHAGTVMGLCNGFSQIAAAASPLIIQFIITDSTNVLQWRTIFFLVSAVNVCVATVFDIFGTAKVQSWNEMHKVHETS